MSVRARRLHSPLARTGLTSRRCWHVEIPCPRDGVQCGCGQGRGRGAGCGCGCGDPRPKQRRRRVDAPGGAALRIHASGGRTRGNTMGKQSRGGERRRLLHALSRGTLLATAAAAQGKAQRPLGNPVPTKCVPTANCIQKPMVRKGDEKGFIPCFHVSHIAPIHRGQQPSWTRRERHGRRGGRQGRWRGDNRRWRRA